MEAKEACKGKVQRCGHKVADFLFSLILMPFLLLSFSVAARADFTVAYDLDTKNFYKPAAAGNTQTGDFLVAYLDPVQCTEPVPYFEVRATLRDSSGNPKATGLAPLGACNHRALGRPAVAYSPQSDVFCVAAPTTARPSGPFFVLVGFINGDGTPVEPFNVYYVIGADSFYEGFSGHGSLHVVHNSLRDEFVVTVQVTESGTNRIWAQRITPSGAKTGSIVELATYGASGIQSHGIAHAPIGGTSPSGGRYLFVDDGGSVELLNADLVPLCVTYNSTGCVGEYINLWYGDNEPSGNSDSGDHLHFDVAYGEVEGQKRFLMVYSDGNNCIPGKGIYRDGTGVWGIFIDPARTRYDLNTTQDIIQTYPTPFPITDIADHGILESEWRPRVAYSSTAQAFAVVWRETPTISPYNAANERYSHIRGAWVERYVEDGHYGTDVGTLYGYPPENLVIADVDPSGNCIDAEPYDICESDEDPDFPDVAPVGGGTAVSVWHEYYNPPPVGNPPIIDWPPRWSVRGDLFPVLPPPPNDDWVDAIFVAAGQHEGTLIRATNDGSGTCGNSISSPDVWYKFQATGPGALLVSTCGSNDYFGEDTGVDTVLSLHSPGDGTQIVGMCNDDWPGGNFNSACLTSDAGYTRDSALKYGMSNGQTVLIRVAPYGTSERGPIVLNVAFEAIPDADEDGYTVAEGDCNDNDDTIYPGAPELCDGTDNDCSAATADGSDEALLGTLCDGLDEDLCNEGTFTCTGGRMVCSDNTGNNVEVCDGIDNDCDGQIDEGVGNTYYRDLDVDGYGKASSGTVVACSPPADYVSNSTDCNDGDNTVHPGALELCDGKDNDCDGSVDESLSRQTTCGVGECAGNTGTETCSNGQWVNNTCNPLAGASPEICDSKDNDCDGTADEGLSRQTTCGVGECAGNTGTETCSNGQWVNNTCNPLAGASPEICDSKDNDCDGTLDDGVCSQVVVEGSSGGVTVEVTFGYVEQEGETTFTVGDCGPSPWEGFTLIPVDEPICVDIETSADYDQGSGVMVCISYDDTGMTEDEEKKLVMIHCNDQGKCSMIPCKPKIPVDIDNNVVCGCTDAFSMFGVGIAEDRDEDGIPDVLDNCPDIYDPTNACGGCAADLEGDGDVDGPDLAVFAGAYGSIVGDRRYLSEADFDENGVIDEDDLVVLGAGLGRNDCPVP